MSKKDLDPDPSTGSESLDSPIRHFPPLLTYRHHLCVVYSRAVVGSPLSLLRLRGSRSNYKWQKENEPRGGKHDRVRPTDRHQRPPGRFLRLCCLSILTPPAVPSSTASSAASWALIINASSCRPGFVECHGHRVYSGFLILAACLRNAGADDDVLPHLLAPWGNTL